MRYHVNEDCIGCGLCTGICPEVFSMVGGVSKAKEEAVSGDVQARADEAKDSCPVSAIEEA